MILVGIELTVLSFENNNFFVIVTEKERSYSYLSKILLIDWEFRI